MIIHSFRETKKSVLRISYLSQKTFFSTAAILSIHLAHTLSQFTLSFSRSSSHNLICPSIGFGVLIGPTCLHSTATVWLDDYGLLVACPYY